MVCCPICFPNKLIVIGWDMARCLLLSPQQTLCQALGQGTHQTARGRVRSSQRELCRPHWLIKKAHRARQKGASHWLPLASSLNLMGHAFLGFQEQFLCSCKFLGKVPLMSCCRIALDALHCVGASSTKKNPSLHAELCTIRIHLGVAVSRQLPC